MAVKTVKISARDGLHTRPAALFVQEAKKFSSDITVEFSGKSSNAKSLFKLQLLEISQGAEIRIHAAGDDASAAVDHLADFLTTLQ